MVGDAIGDQRPHEQRVGATGKGADDDENEEHRQLRPVGPGEGTDPLYSALRQLTLLDAFVPPARTHHAPVFCSLSGHTSHHSLITISVTSERPTRTGDHNRPTCSINTGGG